MPQNRSRAFGTKAAPATRGEGAKGVVSKAPPKLFLDTLALVIASGAAIMLGATRDGNTLVITLLDGELRDKVYITDLDEMRQALTDLAAWAAPSDNPPF